MVDPLHFKARMKIACMWPLGPGPSAVTCVGGILAAASPEGGSSSSRLIGDPPEDAVAGAIRRK
jgi:hypothetical protein